MLRLAMGDTRKDSVRGISCTLLAGATCVLRKHKQSNFRFYSRIVFKFLCVESSNKKYNEMTCVCVDISVMWRLSEDLNRRFAARVHHHRPGSLSMIYSGILIF